MVEKLYITWEEFHKDTRGLCEKIKLSGKEYNKIVAVSRGGLIPAGIISYELDLRNVESVNVSSYDGEKQREDNVEFSSNVGVVDEKTLIIDDLSDTGNTYKFLRKIFPKANFIAVYAKPKGISAVDVYQKDMPDKWIVFPWD